MTVSILVKMVAIVVCCLSCVTFLVNLLDAAGIKEIIFIECHCKHFHYSKSYNEFYFSDSDDNGFSENDQKNEEFIISQLQHSFCFTELRLYNFKYTRLSCNCRKTFEMVFQAKLHNVSL